MFQKLKNKKQRLVRFLFGSFSATALMFTFQACYGPPEVYVNAKIQGKVLDTETGAPIKGLQVSIPSLGFTAITDNEGIFEDPSGERSIREWADYDVQVNDIDSTENGLYESLDTTVYAADIQHPLELKVKQHRENS
ncbi:MAG: radical SAM-associated putative lipoprotein [Bacteroidales bacterium]|nr:radical SAM-associated putative lipoprotein [Bacteroidales bacterium]